MLALDDTRWQELAGNYNNGCHTAALLQQAYAGGGIANGRAH